MSGVKNLAAAEKKGLTPITNQDLKKEGVKGADKEKKGELY